MSSMARGRMDTNKTIGETGWAAVAEELAQSSTLETLCARECSMPDASVLEVAPSGFKRPWGELMGDDDILVLNSR